MEEFLTVKEMAQKVGRNFNLLYIFIRAGVLQPRINKHRCKLFHRSQVKEVRKKLEDMKTWSAKKE